MRANILASDSPMNDVGSGLFIMQFVVDVQTVKVALDRIADIGHRFPSQIAA